MGQHYVPKSYLRAFETSPGSGTVWVYDKETRESKEIPIRAVAQARDYYDEDVERQLSSVEGPAHTALAAVQKTNKLTDDERTTLAYYIAVMMYRGPRRRRKGEEIIPSALEKTIQDVLKGIDQWAETRPADDPLVARRRAEVEAAAVKFRVAPPEEVINRLRAPWPSDKVFGIIAQKSWRLFIAKDEPFVTTDSPAFFFEGLGLGNPDSEFTFPLSPSMALLGDWQGEPYSLTTYKVGNGFVREVNRRVVSGAERFVFANRSQRWVLHVAHKKRPFLSRINWRHPISKKA